MKAKDLKPGMVIDGWTVTEDTHVDGEFADDVSSWTEEFVLLELEGTYYLDGHDVNGEEVWWLGAAPEGQPTKTETRRTWYRADEEVDCEAAEGRE